MRAARWGSGGLLVVATALALSVAARAGRPSPRLPHHGSPSRPTTARHPYATTVLMLLGGHPVGPAGAPGSRMSPHAPVPPAAVSSPTDPCGAALRLRHPPRRTGRARQTAVARVPAPGAPLRAAPGPLSPVLRPAGQASRSARQKAA